MPSHNENTGFTCKGFWVQHTDSLKLFSVKDRRFGRFHGYCAGAVKPVYQFREFPKHMEDARLAKKSSYVQLPMDILAKISADASFQM